MTAQGVSEPQRLISSMLDAPNPRSLLQAMHSFASAVFGGSLTLQQVCSEHRGLAALRGLLLAPVDCPAPAAIAACILITSLDIPQITPGMVRFIQAEMVKRAGCVAPLAALFVNGLGQQRAPEGLPLSDVSGTAAVGAALASLLLNQPDAGKQALAVGGYVPRLCQLLRGDEADAKARFFAASHLAVMAKSFKDEGGPLPAPLLQTMRPLLSVLAARRGARLIPGSINERTIVTAALALSHMASCKLFAVEMCAAGAVNTAAPYLAPHHSALVATPCLGIVFELLTSLEGAGNCLSRIGAALAEADALQHVAARLQPDDGEDAADAEQVADGQMTAALILERLARGGDKCADACIAAGAIPALTAVLRAASSTSAAVGSGAADAPTGAPPLPGGALDPAGLADALLGGAAGSPGAGSGCAAAVLAALLDSAAMPPRPAGLAAAPLGAEASGPRLPPGAFPPGLAEDVTEALQGPAALLPRLAAAVLASLLEHRPAAAVAAATATGTLAVLADLLQQSDSPLEPLGALLVKSFVGTRLPAAGAACIDAGLLPLLAAKLRQPPPELPRSPAARFVLPRAPPGIEAAMVAAAALGDIAEHHFAAVLDAVDIPRLAQMLDCTAVVQLPDDGHDPLLQLLKYLVCCRPMIWDAAHRAACPTKISMARLIESGPGLAALVRVLERPHGSVLVMREACQVLTLLAEVGPAAQSALAGAGAVQAAVKVLQAPGAAMTAVSAAAALLHSTCLDHSANQAAFLFVGGAHAAVMQLERWPWSTGDVYAKMASVNLLGEIAGGSKANRQATVAAGAVEAVEAMLCDLPPAGAHSHNGRSDASRARQDVELALHKLRGGGGCGGGGGGDDGGCSKADANSG